MANEYAIHHSHLQRIEGWIIANSWQCRYGNIQFRAIGMASLYSGFCNDRNSRNVRYLSLASFVMYTAVKVLKLFASLPLAWLERIERGCLLLERLRIARVHAPSWPRQMSGRHLKGTTAVFFNTNHFQPGCCCCRSVGCTTMAFKSSALRRRYDRDVISLHGDWNDFSLR